ncbi:IS110 family transposase [Boseongicola sp. H5]|uniref:IS110 family transposase n=1 Tax=Boseongicola sp. H5 TaxID=2763261 RepID=UPI001D09D97C|nr:IS110 family transposase [Boseongicola sp. H5]
MQITTVGLDLAKNIFQVHGITEDGTVAFNKSLRRAQLLDFFKNLEPCLIGMEACGSSHHWARQFQRLGHEVRLMPAIYVKAYVKLGKSDAIDAEAICEAVTRPTMRFVAIKTEEQQGVLFLHRARDLVVRQRTQLSNMLRGLLGEFGIVIAQGIGSAVKFAKAVLDGDCPSIPEVAIDVLTNLSNQMVALHLRILWYDKRILLEGRRNPQVMLLRTIPGVGPVTASAIVATAGDGHQFRNGREFAAWLGLTPINRSSGVREAVWDLVSGNHQGQQPRALRQQAGHTTASDRRSYQLKNVLLCRSHPHKTLNHERRISACWMAASRDGAAVDVFDVNRRFVRFTTTAERTKGGKRRLPHVQSLQIQ